MKAYVVIALALITASCVAQETQPDVVGQPSHHADDEFRNLYIDDNKKKNFFSFLKMRHFGGDPWADHTADAGRMAVEAEAVDSMADLTDAPRLTWLGHSTFLIQYRGKTILTDPFLSDRASPVGFAGPRRLVPKPIDVADLPPIDYVVISHNHYDHLDEATVRALGAGPRYFVPLKLKDWFVDLGLPEDAIQELDWWDSAEAGQFRFIATQSQHWSGRGLFDRYKTLWAAWRIEMPGFSLWFGGDTGYNPVQFKEIRKRLGPVDLALIPIGAYAPRWFMKASHVNPEEAIQIHNDLESAFSIGVHWGTFQLTAEPFFEPEERLHQLVADGTLKSGRFTTLKLGESINFRQAQAGGDQSGRVMAKR